MKHHVKCLIGTAFALFFITSGSFAQKADSSGRSFQLGEVVIKGAKDTLAMEKLDARKLGKFNRMDVSHALNLLPGINLTAVGARNESGVSVRGFDLRQVPIYLDGIPLYVPYDGYVDLARYTTFNLSQIQVSKGYSPLSYGPNAIGGAINLITRKPVKPFEVEAVAGWLSGGYRLNTNIGGTINKFYYQFSASQLKQDFFPLSHDFVQVKTEDGGRRDNSYRNDRGISAKIGFKPDENQEYAIGYSFQRGKKGNPVYAGNDPLNTQLKSPRFWQWPRWDTQSIYALSKNQLGAHNSIQTRWYYSSLKNELNSYDNATYTTITKPFAFRSRYNDYTLGASAVFENTALKNNNFSVAGHYKKDVHKEYNVGEPQRRTADDNFTLSVEDTYQITQKLRFNGGVSFMNRSSDGVEQYNSSTRTVSSLPENNNNAWNLQGLLQYEFDKNSSISASVARKTRFATIKDRYSYRMGTAIPNPDLKAENALHYELRYMARYFERLSVSGSAFYSKIGNSIQSVSNVAHDPVTNAGLSQVQNVGSARYYGFEAGLGYKLSDQLRADVNYSHIVRDNLSNPQVYFTDVPRDKVFGSIEYSPVSRLFLIASEEYNASRYSTSYGTRVSSFYLTNFKAAVRLIKGFSVEGGVNNLFDKNYQLVEGYPEAGRNYYTNLIYTF